jgi:hypothetical protein
VGHKEYWPSSFISTTYAPFSSSKGLAMFRYSLRVTER